MEIRPPKQVKTHPDYGINCEEALDLPLQDLIDRAVQAGWDTRTVMVALQSVAFNRANAYEEDPDPEDADSEIGAL
jgi:hypothetical protein